ncbi:radical SAM protein [candidate division WOR-3 bacterium]|uniref:Radical SAM core domain-containing protein n=1 Tax=marine sediment metagenome TaxID=412755 RepID=X1S927_9ZZZZ|nr:radical SAM protein [candidate division WOR-3 bacterium]TET79339.1 MAG: radical SAM protein [Candidatus Cloacimonadota bacterium]
MKICEIFKSIQGESSYAGWPFVFVRFTGCNLRCAFCDTTYAFEEGFEISEKKLLERITLYGIKSIEITGGEPLLQKGVYALTENLIKRGYTVLLETNGTMDISRLNRNIIRVIDIKCPGSGESDKTRWENLDNLRKDDEVKFVIMNRDDYEWAKRISKKFSLTERFTVNLSPAYNFLPQQKLAGWILEDNLHVRFNLQLHKYIWKGITRGV